MREDVLKPAPPRLKSIEEHNRDVFDQIYKRVPVQPEIPTGVACSRCGNELSRIEGFDYHVGFSTILQYRARCPRCGHNESLRMLAKGG